MENQVTGCTTANIGNVLPCFAVARRNDRVFTGRQFHVNQRTGVVERQYGLPRGFLNNHIHVRSVFISRPDRERHVQVIAGGLLDGLGLILADTAGQVGDAVLLLALHLHPRAVDGLKAGGR
ncbi:hypothetical protein D3C87_1013700 [compost metagenome]